MFTFRAYFAGTYPRHLFYADGRAVLDLMAAGLVAERLYGESWASVGNGSQSMDRGRFLALWCTEPTNPSAPCRCAYCSSRREEPAVLPFDGARTYDGWTVEEILRREG